MTGTNDPEGTENESQYPEQVVDVKRTHEQTARDWDPRTHEENSQGLGPENP